MPRFAFTAALVACLAVGSARAGDATLLRAGAFCDDAANVAWGAGVGLERPPGVYSFHNVGLFAKLKGGATPSFCQRHCEQLQGCKFFSVARSSLGDSEAHCEFGATCSTLRRSERYATYSMPKPVVGTWSAWSTWSSCTEACGADCHCERSTRTRTCNYVSSSVLLRRRLLADHWIACAGAATESKECPAPSCAAGKFSRKQCCASCPQGRFQAKGGQSSCDACAAGKAQSAEGQSGCTDCAAGRFQSAAGQAVCNPAPCCAGGKQAVRPDDRTSATCAACAAGHFKTMNEDGACSAACKPCPAGKFAAKGGAAECTAAAPGFVTESPGMSAPMCCGAGEYQDQHGQSLCKTCRGGTFAHGTCRSSCAKHVCCGHGEYGEHSATASVCLKCAAGSVRQGLGQCDGACTKCGAGKFANADKTGCADCPAGQFSTGAANSACTMCAAGMYQPQHGKDKCVGASAGHFVPSVGLSYQKPHIRCPCGQFGVGASPTEPGTCQNCAAGHFKGAEGAYDEQCAVCPSGQFADRTGFCACTPCAVGEFQDQAAQQSCKKCPAGRYGNAKGAISLHWCPHCAGGQYQEDAGAMSCKKCADGTRGNDAIATHKSSHCASCPAGKFFAQSMVGDAYTASHAAGKCVMCESGQYQHAPQQAKCHPCSEARLPFTAGDTSLHKWWTRNEPGWSSCVKQPFACKPGVWSSWGTCSKPCNGGTQTRTRRVRHDSWGGGTPCSAIDSELFKDGGWVEERSCNDGCCPIDCKASDWAEHVWSTCTRTCGGGVRSRSRPITVEQQCGGAVCTDLNQVETCNSHACPADCAVSSWGAWSECTEACGTGTQARSRKQLKPAAAGGMKCPDLTEKRLCNQQCCSGFHHDGDACTACAAGHFADAEGASACRACPAGRFQTFEGSHGCTACPKGTFQPGTAKTSLERHCQHCGVGTYQDTEGARACKQCAPGRFHGNTKQTAASACTTCAAGQYAAAPGSATCTDCDVGKYSSAPGQSTCTECAAGKHNPYMARFSAGYCYDCPCGKWATSASNVCNDCPSGTYRTAAGGVDASSCTPASVGFEPKRNAAKNLCAQRACPAGRYQDARGLGSCKLCPAGTFSTGTRATDASACSACPAGTWSSLGAFTCTECAAGRFSSQAGADQNGCLACGKGTYSARDGALRCTSCEPGHWQDQAKSTACKKCAAGSFGTASAAKDSGACKRCAAGLRQPDAGQTKCVACESGTYSDGEGMSTCKSCPKGSANGATGSSSSTACQLCGAGHFADAAGSASCKQCALGRAVSSRGSTVASACRHCSAGQFADSVGSAACTSCTKGRHGRRGESGGVSEAVHCVHCPQGKYQQADGMTTCADCASGQYTTVDHDRVSCHACAVLDSVRKYDTRGLAGQKQCWPVPVPCKEGAWQSWSTCTKSCGTGQRTRKRQPLRQPATGPCGLANQDECAAAWGGGAACSSMTWSATEDCNDHACPVDCTMSAWSSWTQCTRTCGVGETSRARVMTRAPLHGGKGCPATHEKRACNEHSCALSALPTVCHTDHVRCAVQQLSLPNSIKRRSGLNTCGFTTSRIDENDPCWEADNCDTTSRRPGWCHEADTDGERELATRYKGKAFPTLVVSHNEMMAGQFHCHRTSKTLGRCHCVCSMHKPCCSNVDRYVENGKVLPGNIFEDVEAKQDCCNMCSNHPQCSAWEYTATKTCSLMRVAAHAVHGVDIVLINKKPSGAPKSWAGARAGVKCMSATKFY